MGRATRYNAYDKAVSDTRKLSQSYGQARQRLSITSSFRSMPLVPNKAQSSSSGGGGTGTGTYCTASLSADQTANLGANDHVEFDTLDADGGIELQTGAGQLDGIFELSSGKRYFLSALLRPEFSGATGQLVVAWYDITNSAEIGKRTIYEAQTHASDNANQPNLETIVAPETNITVELRIISVTALTALANEYCVANLFEIALGGSVGSPQTNAKTWTGDVTTIASGAASQNIDVSASSWYVITLDKDMAITFTNKPDNNDTVVQITLEYIQDSTGGWTVTYTDTIAPSDPTPVETANSREVITGFIRKTNAGTYVYNLYLVGN